MDRPRFLADEMLGSLARWLRMIGYDTEYVRDLPDGEVLALARREGRTILTRDRQLAERAGDEGLLITGDDLDGQLGQVVSAFGLRADRRMTRCTICNGELRLTPAGEVAGRVPERVLAIRDEIFVCQKCGQVYWKGTHWDDIGRRMERVLGPRSGNSPR
ncbi:MAG: Mut7-C RNAse domain-containing protein [Methanomassiliicoccus sp.]|nr:Mut7-C RNAse domain-containing protein [Methanomassiliicoccus sp.]